MKMLNIYGLNNFLKFLTKSVFLLSFREAVFSFLFVQILLILSKIPISGLVFGEFLSMVGLSKSDCCGGLSFLFVKLFLVTCGEDDGANSSNLMSSGLE